MGERMISVAQDFSEFPGGRYYSDGPKSGQEFRETLLLPTFREVLSSGDTLVVDLDGAFGLARSFLEEAFGGLAREVGVDTVSKFLVVKATQDPRLKDRVLRYVNGAAQS